MSKIIDPTPYTQKDWYRGIEGLKAKGAVTYFTQEMLQEALLCKHDLHYFASNYAMIQDRTIGSPTLGKVVLFQARDYQKRFWDLLTDHRRVIAKMGRQAGKCVDFDTLVEIQFLDSKTFKLEIGIAHNIFASIAKYKAKNKDDYGISFTKQIHKNIQFPDRETKEAFDRLWGSASYLAKKSWWIGQFGEPSQIDRKRSISASDENVQEENSKITEEFQIEGFSVSSDSGQISVKKSFKTKEFEVFEIETEDGHKLRCADNHILFGEYKFEYFLKELSVGSKIYTKNGLSKIISITHTKEWKEMYDLEVCHKDHRYYTNGVLSHNSTSLAVYILWYILFNSNKNVMVAAHKLSLSAEIVDRIKKAYELLPTWIQTGIVTWNKKSIELANGSRVQIAASSDDGIRGESIDILVLDEFAHYKNDASFWESAEPTVAANPEAKIVIISTPNGKGNEFFKIWEGGESGATEWKTLHVDWNEIPGRDEEFRRNQIASIGIKRWNQEYAALFEGSSNTLVDDQFLTILRKKAKDPIRIEKNILDTEVKIFEEPQPGRFYVMAVDVSRGGGGDFSTFTVIDATESPYKTVATFKSNTLSPIIFPDLICKYATLYDEAVVIIERNDLGDSIINELHYELEYTNVFIDSERANSTLGVWTTTKVKKKGCLTLKELIETSNIEILDIDIVEELETFEGDKRGIFNASGAGNYDDLVQNLWLFASVLETRNFKMFAPDEFDGVKNMIHKKNMEELSLEEIPPIGIFGNAQNADDANRLFQRTQSLFDENGNAKTIKIG